MMQASIVLAVAADMPCPAMRALMP
jgi:hypothetical protein